MLYLNRFSVNKLILFIFLLGLTSCSSKYIKEVNPETKTKFGFEIPAPNQAVFFVENKNIKISGNKVNNHIAVANAMYHKHGPAKDNFFIGITNARDFKFNLANKTYYITVENLPKRTAMILFDGEHKPNIAFNYRNYSKLIAKIKKK